MDRFLRSKHRIGVNVSGSMAVEFALLAPLFILLMFGLICFAIIFSIASGIQQLASESARASVAGLSDTERTHIVQDFVAAHVGSYPFVLPGKLVVSTASVTTPAAAFTVSMTYDLTSQGSAIFGSLLPFLPSTLRREAVVLISTSL